MPMKETLNQELNSLWKEKQEIENPKDELSDEDNFVPAQESKMNPSESLVHQTL